MKGIVIFIIIASLVYAIWQYSQTKDTRKILIVLASFAFVGGLAMAGRVTIGIKPIYYAHMLLEVFAWFGVIYYMIKDRYYWWIIASPLLTIALYVGLDYTSGSRHESIKA